MHVWKLKDQFELREQTPEEFRPFFLENRPKLFGENFTVMPDTVLSQEEKVRSDALASRMGDPFKIRLGLFEGERQIGWSFGYQIDRETFYMMNSAVFPEFRRLGLYQAMLEKVKDLAAAEGFQQITSKHIATNSPIIIAKLKSGFVITGFEMWDTFGVLVNLTYHTSPLRRKLLDVRAGATRPDDELKALFKL